MIWRDEHLVASKIRLLSLHTCSNSCNEKKKVPLHLFKGILNISQIQSPRFPSSSFSALLISWIGWSPLSLWNFHFQVFSHKFGFWSYFFQLQPPKHSDSIPQIRKSFHKLLLGTLTLWGMDVFCKQENSNPLVLIKTLLWTTYTDLCSTNKTRKKTQKKERAKMSVDKAAFAVRLTQSPTESRRPSPEAGSPKPSPEAPTGKYPSGPGRYKFAPTVIYI